MKPSFQITIITSLVVFGVVGFLSGMHTSKAHYYELGFHDGDIAGREIALMEDTEFAYLEGYADGKATCTKK